MYPFFLWLQVYVCLSVLLELIILIIYLRHQISCWHVEHTSALLRLHRLFFLLVLFCSSFALCKAILFFFCLRFVKIHFSRSKSNCQSFKTPFWYNADITANSQFSGMLFFLIILFNYSKSASVSFSKILAFSLFFLFYRVPKFY